MLGLGPEWETPVNIVFLCITAAIAVHSIRYRTKDGDTSFVHLLFGSIAAVFFCLVLFQDVLGLVEL